MTAPQVEAMFRDGFYKTITVLNIDNYKKIKADQAVEQDADYEQMKNHYAEDFNKTDIVEKIIPGGDG